MKSFILKHIAFAFNTMALVTILVSSTVGQAQFGTPQTFPGGGGYDLDTGDFNADGNLDIVVANPLQTVRILFGDGGGNFNAAPSLPITVGGAPRGVAVGDVDGDGRDDIVVCNAPVNQVTVILSSLNYGMPAPYGSGATLLYDVELADFDEDGDLDIVASAVMSDCIVILTNNGAGTFALQPCIPTSTQPRKIATGDVNGDGHVDVAVAAHIGAEIAIHLGTGSGAFMAGSPLQMTPGSGAYEVAVVDIDGDLDLDVLATSTLLDRLWIGTNMGGGVFAPTLSPIGVGNEPYCLVAADFNGDALADVAVGCVLDTTGINLFESTMGALSGAPTFIQPGAIAGLTAADVDGDGDPDLIASHEAPSTDIFVIPNTTVFASSIYPGSNEDFEMAVAINGAPAMGVPPGVSTVTTGDTVLFSLGSPGGSYDFGVPILAAQVIQGLQAAPGPFPGMWISPVTPVIILVNAFPDPVLGNQLLAPGGNSYLYSVPSVIPGLRVMFQSFCLPPSGAGAPSPLNGFFAVSDGHELRF